MKTLKVARKFLVEMGREPQLLALTILTPLLFILVFVVAYNRPLLVTHPIMVASQGDNITRAAAFIATLSEQRYPDGRSIFTIQTAQDEAAAEAALKDRQVDAFVIVDASKRQNPAQPISITIRGDALYMNYIKAGTLINSALQNYNDQVAGIPESIRIREESLQKGQVSTLREYEAYAPGLLIFAILLLIPQTAMLIGRELRWGTLRRLRLTTLNTVELLTGISLAQMVFAVCQVILVFLAIRIVGWQSGSLALSLSVGLVLSFSAIGLGLIVACFIRNDSQALNIGSIVTMLQVFLSGSFFPLPSPTLFTLNDHAIGVFDIFPATHGMLALQQVVTYGAGWTDVRFRLGLTVALSILYFIVSILVFQTLQMRRSP